LRGGISFPDQKTFSTDPHDKSEVEDDKVLLISLVAGRGGEKKTMHQQKQGIHHFGEKLTYRKGVPRGGRSSFTETTKAKKKVSVCASPEKNP